VPITAFVFQSPRTNPSGAMMKRSPSTSPPPSPKVMRSLTQSRPFLRIQETCIPSWFKQARELFLSKIAPFFPRKNGHHPTVSALSLEHRMVPPCIRIPILLFFCLPTPLLLPFWCHLTFIPFHYTRSMTISLNPLFPFLLLSPLPLRGSGGLSGSGSIFLFFPLQVFFQSGSSLSRLSLSS